MNAVQIASSFDLYQFLLNNNGRIVANMLFPWSPGHMISELDNFLRMRRLGEVPADALCLIPVMEHPITQTIAQIYAPLLGFGHRNLYTPNNQIYAWAREIARACPEMVVDVSVGHARYVLKEPSENRLSPFQGLLHHQLTNQAVIACEVDWRRRRQRTMDYQPLADQASGIDAELADFLGGRTDKIALVHARHVTANIGTKSDPTTFMPALEHLRDTGHVLVFVSREPCPEEFTRLGVLNYAQNPIASFRNDLALFKAAKLAIISGAGIGAIAQAMSTPMVWTNSWGLSIPFTGPACVWLPTLLRLRKTGRLLRFIEQIDYFHNRPECWELKPDQYSGVYGNPWSFQDKVDDYEFRLPQGDEMLEAVKEAQALTNDWQPRSNLQEQFSSLAQEKSGLPFMEGRVSQYFIERFAEGLSLGFCP